METRSRVRKVREEILETVERYLGAPFLASFARSGAFAEGQKKIHAPQTHSDPVASRLADAALARRPASAVHNPRARRHATPYPAPHRHHRHPRANPTLLPPL